MPDTKSIAEQHLPHEFTDCAAILEREIGYNPTYFMGMVADHRRVDACKRLIHSTVPSEGFSKLWEARKLDMTVEAISLLPWYDVLFDDRDRAEARRRLEAHEFDADGFLAQRTAAPPAWWHG
ncbi:MAG: hypothetical protein M0Z46_19515 [Actinomycetota bacterium]|nr:hypothetical protein [Actinomycetota bacterium]